TRLRKTLKLPMNRVCSASRPITSFRSEAERTRLKKNSNHTGTKRMQIAAIVQFRAETGNISQLRRNSRKVAGSTKLRRKLSSIFHCETSEIGLGTLRPVSSGTRDNSQLVICQSPRSQRCLRRL